MLTHKTKSTRESLQRKYGCPQMQLSQLFQRHFVTTQAKNLTLSNHTCFLPLYLTDDSKLKQSRQANETSEMNATSF